MIKYVKIKFDYMYNLHVVIISFTYSSGIFLKFHTYLNNDWYIKHPFLPIVSHKSTEHYSFANNLPYDITTASLSFKSDVRL